MILMDVGVTSIHTIPTAATKNANEMTAAQLYFGALFSILYEVHGVSYCYVKICASRHRSSITSAIFAALRRDAEAGRTRNRQDPRSPS